MISRPSTCSDIPSDKVQLSPSTTPGYTHADGLTEESAERASTLLTQNHVQYHNRWNQGFHNHMSHHLLALWSLGATPDEIQEMWDYNVPYQAPIDRNHPVNFVDMDLNDPEVFDSCLGKDCHYVDFLEFFQNEIDHKGVPNVVREYVLKGDERANDIFARMYTDLVHPMIHLGCGIEWKQPSVVAEALAGACAHDNWPKDFLFPTEEYVKRHPDVKSTTILGMCESLHRDPAIAAGVKETDPFNKIADGLMKRVSGDQWASHLGLYRVQPTPRGIRESLSEMMYTGAYLLGASQKPGKREALDFVLLHNATLSGYYPAIIAQDWITNEEKARLLEAKARVDAVMYAGCGSPQLYPERITDYVPQFPHHSWQELFHRAVVYRDEGHAAKLIRSLYALEIHCHESTGYLPIDKEDFFKIAHMSMDSIEKAMRPGGTCVPEAKKAAVRKQVGHGSEMVLSNMTRWVFYNGLPNAWNHVLDVQVTE